MTRPTISGRSPTRRRGWRLPLVAIAALLAVGLSVAPQVVPVVAAAAPELQITADARYDVQPDRARVHVTLNATITNTHRDAGTARTYFDTAVLAVVPGTANFKATSPGVEPAVSIRSQTSGYTLLTITLGRRLFAGKHTPLQLQFDLLDKGGTALRDVRVGANLVAFPVWAFATQDTPGGSVTIAFPSGYNVQQQVGNLPDPTAGPGGTQVVTSGTLKTPLTFYAYFVADRPGAFTETRLSASVSGSSVPITVRAWTDDPAWATRVGSLVGRGLPALSSAIGLPYRGTGLVVQESVSRTIGGYAGIFDPVAATIQVAYYAGPFVVLHEAAHAWFNGKLASDRWILEAFASWYAEEAATSLAITANPPGLTDDLRAAAIPLNAWPGVGRADETTENYAYAATVQLAGAIAARAGEHGMRNVWQAAANGEFAYQPFRLGASVERGATAPDWRGLLDLLEERTSADYTDLWTRWVVRPDEAHLLDERLAARAAYAQGVVAAGEWELPASIRQAMSAWQFAQAQALIAQAQAVLARRATIATAATAAGLTLPNSLRTAFEGPGGPPAAADEADREVATIALLVAADASSRAVSGPVAQLGLVGLRPESEMVDARATFAEGNMAAAQSHAATAQSIWQSADDRGRQRLLSIAAVILGVFVLILSAIVLLRTRRARQHGE